MRDCALTSGPHVRSPLVKCSDVRNSSSEDVPGGARCSGMTHRRAILPEFEDETLLNKIEERARSTAWTEPIRIVLGQLTSTVTDVNSTPGLAGMVKLADPFSPKIGILEGTPRTAGSTSNARCCAAVALRGENATTLTATRMTPDAHVKARPTNQGRRGRLVIKTPIDFATEVQSDDLKLLEAQYSLSRLEDRQGPLLPFRRASGN